MASAPLTSYDPAGDGRWQVPSVKVLSYLGRIENPSVRDSVALFALLRADRQQKSIYNQIANFVRVLRRVMIEQSIEDITSVDANDLLFRIHVGEIGKGLSEHQRRTLLGQWSAVRNAFDEYAERLTPEQLEVMKNFFIGPVTDRRRFMRHKTYGAYLREQQERVKIKTDAVQSKFYQLRHVAGIRCNQVRRLHEAAGHAIAAVEANDLRCPYEFSYEETAQTMGRRAVRQRVELTLWDSNSLREHAGALGYHEAPATTLQRRWQEASFSPKNRAYFVEYNATTSLTQGCPADPFRLLDHFRHRVLRHLDVRSDSDLAERREAFHAEWGYENKSAWADGGLLAFGPTDFRPIDFLQSREGHEFLPYEGIYAACMFIDEDTKRHLVELIRFQCEKWGGPLIPIVKIEDDKRAPDRYVLQWNGRGLRLHVLNTFVRFLLHGLILRSLDGNVVQLSSRLLRHSFATEMADLNTPVEVIAKLLHQRDLTVTKYYARPTPTKVMSAAEMIFVDRIDLGAEGRRSPDEIGRMLKEAEGIELDTYRVEQAREVGHHVIHGDALDVHCPLESLSLLYLNPPYDFECGQSQNRRLEQIFFEHCYRWLKPAGVLVLVVPGDRLAVCGCLLAFHFKDNKAYRLGTPEAAKYKQAVLLGTRRTRREWNQLSDADLIKAQNLIAEMCS